MTAIRNVTGTAFVVAEFRAEENRESCPLYRDPIVPLFLDEETTKAAERISASFPPIKKIVRLRTRYLDDRLDDRLSLGYEQIVIVGAGLDTRAVRKSAPSVHYFEIDDESILEFKKAKFDENRIDTKVRFIPGNYVRNGLFELLKKSDFDCDRLTHFIWEGNTMYLTEATVDDVLADIARHVRQFTISFDYFSEDLILKTTGDPELTSVVERFSAMGAPWNYGVNDFQSLADRATLTILKNIKVVDLYWTYWPGQPLDSAIYDHYSICTLQSVAR
ncbi:MAG TPA: SAM-dependent methyltransferase [Methylocella sp.]|nr:SAM-dependent methyltransferase [Methylocella sp.]